MFKAQRIVKYICVAAGLIATNVQAHGYTGGLHFMPAPELVLERQEIKLSPKQVKVDYLFVNNSVQDITETLVLPTPSLVTVDNQPIQYTITQRAISQDGIDVSNILLAIGLPLDPVAAMHKLDVSQNRDSISQRLKAHKLLDKDQELPAWTIKTYYSWRQVFPAASKIAISQTYSPEATSKPIKLKDNSGILNMLLLPFKTIVNLAVHWSLEDKVSASKLQQQLEKQNPMLKNYCPTLADYQAILQLKSSNLDLLALNYATNDNQVWAAPIKQFKLKITSDHNTHAMLCWNNEFVKQTGKNTIAFEAENYVPQPELSVLYVIAASSEESSKSTD